MVFFIQFSYVVILCLITYDSNVEQDSEEILKISAGKFNFKYMLLFIRQIINVKIVIFTYFFHQR